jgi:lipopolysaccharide export system protein LptA
MARINWVCLVAASLLPGLAQAQALDLSHGGPVTVTALGGIDWNQGDQTVTAHDDARATRGEVTVTADRLIAHYRKKATAPGAKPAGSAAAAPATIQQAAATPAEANGPPSDTGSNEIYRLEAEGHVHIFTQTDQAWGDHGIYDIDQAVLVLTGHALKLTTPQDVLTARDAMEYWSQKHMAVGRGDASATSNDGRRIVGDTLVAYMVDSSAPRPPGAPAPKVVAKTVTKTVTKTGAKAGASQDPLEASGKIQRVEAYGHVQVRTATEIVNGDRGVYVPDTGLARVVGRVHITRGENQLNGAEAIVNMKTGIATMIQRPGSRVQGLVVPNDPQAKTAPAAGKASESAGTASKPARHDAKPETLP